MCHAPRPELAEGKKNMGWEKERKELMLWKRRVVDSTDLQFNQWGASVNEYQPSHLLSPHPSLSCIAYLIFYSINIFIFPALSPHLQVYICLHVARLWSHTSSPLKFHTCCKDVMWKLQRCTTMQPADQLIRLTGREKKGRRYLGYRDIDIIFRWNGFTLGAERRQ